MANEQDRKQNPETGSESDISKSQSQQQPLGQDNERREPGAQSGQFETGQQGQQQFGQDQNAASPEAEQQGDTVAQQRTDIEGGSLGSKESGEPETGEPESGFVGAEGQQDTSSELVEDEDFERDGQGAPEGK